MTYIKRGPRPAAHVWVEVSKELGSLVWMRVQIRGGVAIHIQLSKDHFPTYWESMPSYMVLINETLDEIIEQEGVSVSNTITFTIE